MKPVWSGSTSFESIGSIRLAMAFDAILQSTLRKAMGGQFCIKAIIQRRLSVKALLCPYAERPITSRARMLHSGLLMDLLLQDQRKSF